MSVSLLTSLCFCDAQLDLNRSLDEFYDKYALKKAAREWLGEHPLRECMDGADEQTWMAK
jgi:hypothetical protein